MEGLAGGYGVQEGSMVSCPIILGIVGDSAAGKTTLTRGIAQILGEDQVTIICTDDYHRYDRKQRKEMGISTLTLRLQLHHYSATPGVVTHWPTYSQADLQPQHRRI
jgi:ABC-type phosphonate transport system ATPase subunit